MPSAIEYRDFWSVTVEEVPGKTGAAGVMDCADIREVTGTFQLDLGRMSVLDVGCGTGRVAQMCGSWTGVDVSPAAVAYCRNQGLDAYVIEAPVELAARFDAPFGAKPFDLVACLSVFTHIHRNDRRSYLSVFRSLADVVLVDVLPGEEGGSIAAWYADVADFEVDLHDARFDDIVATYERVSADGASHLYYLVR